MLIKIKPIVSIALAAAFVPAAAAQAQTFPTVHRAAVAMPATGAKDGGRSQALIIPFSNIGAYVRFVDNGSRLSISGRGSGFNANLSYISFFYGTGSVPRGSLACSPPTPNNLTIPQMITAYWLPVGSTNRTLTVTQSGASYTPLSTIGTMSVRYDTNPTQPITAMNLTPGRFFLNSCGAVGGSLGGYGTTRQ